MRPGNVNIKRKTRAATGRVILRFRLSSAPDHVVYNVNALQTVEQIALYLFTYKNHHSRVFDGK